MTIGAFHGDCEIVNPRTSGKSARVRRLLVDGGAECTWIPAAQLEKAGIAVRKKDVEFLMANGQTVRRDVGYAILRAQGFETVDEVVFARRGDLRLLGARTLEGFAAVVDARRRKRVAWKNGDSRLISFCPRNVLPITRRGNKSTVPVFLGGEEEPVHVREYVHVHGKRNWMGALFPTSKPPASILRFSRRET